ncbi:AtpZ/AtpI family protein [bacterium]|nr:MAG: AtpZ/AtpI family protein [bacterium]
MNTNDKKPLKNFADSTRQLGPFMTWGWQFALTLGFLSWFGHWLDEKFETKVLFVLTGVFLGLFGGFYNLYRIVSNLPKPGRAKKEKDRL